jgi:SNF2 family DNA or RNA helicase
MDPTGKMEALDRLLSVIKSTTKDRVVIVSNFKQSLDVMQTLCKQRSYRFVRLDGSTPTGQRQSIVDRFNDQTSDYCACPFRLFNSLVKPSFSLFWR